MHIGKPINELLTFSDNHFLDNASGGIPLPNILGCNFHFRCWTFVS